MTDQTIQDILYLIDAWERGADAKDYPNEIAALRQALAQPEQEPVAWEKSYDIVCALLRQAHDILATTQYPIKRPWVSLTDEEKAEIFQADWNMSYEMIDIAEAKLKEKNT